MSIFDFRFLIVLCTFSIFQSEVGAERFFVVCFLLAARGVALTMDGDGVFVVSVVAPCVLYYNLFCVLNNTMLRKV